MGVYEGAQVAQLVEQRIEDPRVGGSIPSLGTIPNHRLVLVLKSVWRLNGLVLTALIRAMRQANPKTKEGEQA